MERRRALARLAAVGMITATVGGLSVGAATAVAPARASACGEPALVSRDRLPSPVRSWADGGTVFGRGSVWGLRYALDAGPVLRPDGTYAINKLPWYVLPPGGKPAITGRRVDGPGVFRADANVAFGSTVFATSSLDFSTVGCWEVTARYNGTTVRFPVKVRARTPSS